MADKPTPKYTLNKFYYMALDTKLNIFVGSADPRPSVVKTRCSREGYTRETGFNNQKRYILQKFALTPVPMDFTF